MSFFHSTLVRSKSKTNMEKVEDEVMRFSIKEKFSFQLGLPLRKLNERKLFSYTIFEVIINYDDGNVCVFSRKQYFLYFPSNIYAANGSVKNKSTTKLYFFQCRKSSHLKDKLFRQSAQKIQEKVWISRTAFASLNIRSRNSQVNYFSFRYFFYFAETSSCLSSTS